MKGLFFFALFALSVSAHATTASLVHAFTPSEGLFPGGGVTLYQGNFYGTTEAGGVSGLGNVYRLYPKKDGTYAFVDLHDFNGADGKIPTGSLAVDSTGNLYGITSSGGAFGGSFGYGTVYELIRPSNLADTWTFVTLYDFSTAAEGNPSLGLVFSNGALYGTANNLVFRFTQSLNSGWQFETIWSFSGQSVDVASLPFIDNMGAVYAATVIGGQFSMGSVFKLTQDSLGVWQEQDLHSFSPADTINSPMGAVIVDPTGVVYGTTDRGGTKSGGAIFKLTPSGNGNWSLTVLHSFDPALEGSSPRFSLVYHSKGYYGVLNQGAGGNSGGAVFKANPSPTTKQWAVTILYDSTGFVGDTLSAQIIIDRSGTIYGAAGAGGDLIDCNGGCGSVYKITQ